MNAGRYQDYKFLNIVVSDGVATVTLNRPDIGNAFDASDHREMATIWREFAEDDNVRVAILTGAGERWFCAGPQHSYLKQLGSPTADEFRNRAFDEAMLMANSCIEFDKPVITALNGGAHGMGLAFALFADIIIAEEQVFIQDAHVNAGLTAGDGGTLLWPLAMGLTKAKRYLLTGDRLSAEDAERAGLVSEVVKRGQSKTRARQFADRFSRGPQMAIRSTKRSLNQWLKTGAVTTLHYAWAQEIVSMTTPDAAKASDAFLKREPGVMPPDVSFKPN